MTSIADQVDRLIEEHSLLKHPFYQAWQRGELTLDHLRHYCAQYFHHVLAFPQYVSGAYTNCPDPEDRREVLDNLIEEDHGPENHPELWLRFGEALGLTREQITESDIDPKTRDFIETYRDITKNGTFAEGATALYCYESQIPEVAKTKIAGLKEFYGIDDERGIQFFTVHIGADEWHAEVGRNFVERYGADDPEATLATAQRCVKTLWRFLDGVYEKTVAAGSPA
jgi:pyrroloquinoline-quinone synthase